METFEQRSEGSEDASHVGIGERAFQAEGKASAKALRWEWTQPCVEQQENSVAR